MTCSYLIAAGDKRDYVIVDIAGNIHSLARRITRVYAKDIREKMDGYKAMSIDEAQALQKEARELMKYDPLKEEHRKLAEIEDEKRKREEIVKEQDRKRDEIVREGEGRTRAIVEYQEAITKAIVEHEEAKKTAILENEEAKQAAILEGLKQQPQTLSTLAAEIERAEYGFEERDKQIKTSLGDVKRQIDENLNRVTADRLVLDNHKTLVKEHREAVESQHVLREQSLSHAYMRRHPDEELFKNAHTRYLQNLPVRYDPRNHTNYLIDASNNEFKAFSMERESLTRQIAEAKTPEDRQKLEMRRSIQDAEYMAITDRRIAAQSEIVTGKLNSEQAQYHRQRAQYFEEMSKSLREQYRELGVSKDKTIEQQKPIEKEYLVVDKTPGAIQTPEKLSSYVKELPEKVVPVNPYVKRLNEEARRRAIVSIATDIKHGKNINKQDVFKLSNDELKQIREGGGQALKDIIDAELQRIRTHAREHGYGYER